ncbi:unnamed protein product [Ranitomeya imitator]|uniref:PiggyBac transposable element-derived protein domain-containing protein n=1 Tax=Ranitomeya imitator TaxID=111125 RepID=A0ABN9MHW3_9NEOB|nr:unnamed protein product [Ranitomeya imitator]
MYCILYVHEMHMKTLKAGVPAYIPYTTVYSVGVFEWTYFTVSGTEGLIFGSGTQLFVTPNEKNITAPQVFKLKTEGDVYSVSCLAKDFYPKEIEIYVNNIIQDNISTILSKEGLYSAVSVQNGRYEDFTCEIRLNQSQIASPKASCEEEQEKQCERKGGAEGSGRVSRNPTFSKVGSSEIGRSYRKVGVGALILRKEGCGLEPGSVRGSQCRTNQYDLLNCSGDEGIVCQKFGLQLGPECKDLHNIRFTSDEIMRMLEESDSEHEDEPYVPSDDENYVPQVDVTEEDSDIEQEMVIEHENEYESDESVEDDSVPQSAGDIWTAKDETQWCSNPLPNAQTKSRNVLRQRGGPAAISNLYTAKELFKSIMTPEVCDIILRETNRKAKRVCDAYNNELVQRFPDSSKRPPQKTFKQFTETELHAFLGILIAAGVHRANKENLEEMWNVAALPLIRAAMSRDRFKMILRFIRFDNENTRAERVQTDKAAPIRDIWTMLNSNLERAYKPYHCITVDEHLFPFRGHTKIYPVYTFKTS